MSKIYIYLAVFLLIVGVYYAGVDAGKDSVVAGQAETDKKAAIASKKKADEILALKASLKIATGKKIYVIKKVIDETGCLDASLESVGLDGLL